MGVKIEETFRVHAPVERVWGFLLDPHQVVQCLPGAELLEAQDERNFVGRVRVKVGPITASYKGKAELTDIDEQAHSVRMTGVGQEAGGAGSARMVMSSRIAPTAEGDAEVHVEADVQLVGKLAQFGRGMVEEVSKQLFAQFAECTRQRLEAEAGAPGSGSAAAGGSAATTESSSGPATSATPGAGSSGTGATTAEPGPARPAAGAAAAASPAAPPGAAAAKPVSILPLLFRAIRARIARLLGLSAGK